jgi:hypothetical protein
MIIASLIISACAIALPGEGYVSTGCSILDQTPILGEWIPDPNDYVLIDYGLCVENSHYWVGGVALYNVYDGAPPCSPHREVVPSHPPPSLPSLPSPPPIVISPIIPQLDTPSEVPEPNYGVVAGLVLLLGGWLVAMKKVK